MNLQAGQHVLDAGCGIGDAMCYVACTVECRVMGIDLTRPAPAAGVPPLGLHIVMGETAREELQNMLANVESRALAPTVMPARRAM